VLGQETERGRPLLRSWGATDYRASPQVARVAVGPDGVLYFASANLLLWYDGHEFGRLETPLSHIRAMVVQPDGSIFLGGTRDRHGRGSGRRMVGVVAQCGRLRAWAKSGTSSRLRMARGGWRPRHEAHTG